MAKIPNLVFSLGILIVLFSGCRYKRHPTDASLQKSFQTNFATLSRIVRELKTESGVGRIDWANEVVVVNGSQTNPPTLTTKLLPEFRAIGQDLVITCARDGSQVWFYFSSRGLSVSGSAKGIAYREKIPDRIVQDTDKSSRTNTPFTVFRPLQTNWFIFLSR